MPLRPEIRELVLLFAQQAAREILAAEAAALADAETKKPRDLSGDGAKDFRNAESIPIP
ncbi:MAG: hypothetical protein V9E93_19565 [Steroidobacteraceae bacterium]|nr:hypothetical protein [Pseudomonadota bacterium]MBP6106733.1 hypothetical protein [Steroidobacteraceae bacterium]MBP7013164.1 hypothetical protein [Steroidobacteraceae bacterium]